jgi:glycosyltransferase involved in cell wall biosynthesis
MKVIFLPNNTSSLVSVYVPNLRRLGVHAVGYNFAPLKISDTKDVHTWPQQGKYLKLQRLKFLMMFVSDLLSSDVIHWVYAGNSRLTRVALTLIRFLNKKKFVEFSGTDVRVLEDICIDVPHFEMAKFSEKEKFLLGTYSSSQQTQERFSKAGFHPIPSYPELTFYIDPKFFKRFHLTSRSVNIHDLAPVHVEKKVPLFVHAPSNPEIKGTAFVNEAANKLVSEGLIDYKLLTGLTHAEALSLLKHADVIIDQLIVGEYGVLAIEGMALGKPIICFIRPQVLKFYQDHFADFPIVNADTRNIYEVMKDLALDATKRKEIGNKSRKFAELYHDPKKTAERLIEIYKSNY